MTITENGLFKKSKVPTMNIQSLVVYICASFTLKNKIYYMHLTICTKHLSATWKICFDSDVKTNLIPFVFKFVLKAWEISITIKEIITILAA